MVWRQLFQERCEGGFEWMSSYCFTDAVEGTWYLEPCWKLHDNPLNCMTTPSTVLYKHPPSTVLYKHSHLKDTKMWTGACPQSTSQIHLQVPIYIEHNSPKTSTVFKAFLWGIIRHANLTITFHSMLIWCRLFFILVFILFLHNIFINKNIYPLIRLIEAWRIEGRRVSL